ncbi:MAG: L-lysine 6-transaminase [Acidimicrobiales bacterium]|jgi:L-lysine 6-transaminase
MKSPQVQSRIAPHEVRERLAEQMLVDGFPIVLDLSKSHGCRLVDARDGTEYLDFYTFFGSAPLGMNPAGLFDDPTTRDELVEAALNKPANAEVPTVQLAEFVDTFTRVLGDPALPHLFLIEGGALAVENTLKCSFDWKSRRNEAAGRSPELGTRVLHLKHAFHGRSGYTMSLTNTDPVKTDRYPKFDWPRISSPAVHFPLEAHLAEVEAAEKVALAEAKAAFEAHPHDIACFIAEPIQCEGGDRHLRSEFLLGIQALCHEYDALFIMDEVQTGGGATGTPWCYQQLGLSPDLVAFGKKVQLGGVMAGRRVHEVDENVFRTPGRIDSTWGGNLTDMVRSRRLLELVEQSGAIANAGTVGHHLLERLQGLEHDWPKAISNARGRGFVAAFDLESRELRTALLSALWNDEHVIAFGCGERTLRLRPALSMTAEEVDAGCDAMGRVLSKLS